uniref:CCHC-type domain-containing protein n=1 Tax=Tanacetum cinerariifolium TaxID=118510 RepID=A0A699HTW8_TANCI|nr:hypothetical protein [Tanacetum cinerariifolium]
MKSSQPPHHSIFGKLLYEENLINGIYDTNKEKTIVLATPLLTAFFSTSIVQDFQDSLDDEEDLRSSQVYMNDLEEEYQARALLDKSKRFFKKGTQSFSSAKATDQTKCHKCGKKGHFARDCWSKTSVPSYQSSFQPKDQEELSSEDNEVTEVKAMMALTDNVSITDSNKPRLSEAENSTLSNNDTSKIPSFMSQRNITNPSIVVTESSASNYDSADESLVYSTLLPPL